MKPKGWPAGKAYDPDGGCIFHGSKDTLICGLLRALSMAAFRPRARFT
jgi:hypothetical protein